LGVLD